jgi:transcriptional regulator with XRE-family HTH domain
MSQRELALRARTSPATVARIEKGRMEPTLDLLARLARAAGAELRVTVAAPDSDDVKARAQARKLNPEQRLRQNDHLSRLRAAARRA